MILGVGVDLCQVERIRRSLARLGDDWISELFSTEERKLCEQAANRPLLYARAYCGKEAYLKALGTGKTADIGWLDIEVLQSGPLARLRLSGGALKQLQELVPAGHGPVLQINCAGGAQVAQAVVIISTILKR